MLELSADSAKPFHPGQYQRSTTVQWFTGDEKTQYEIGMADPFYREYFQERGWDRPEAITYQFNSEGFRCEEFDSSPCLVALGCSFTLGNALPVDSVWPSLLGKELGLKVVNLGYGGQSADYCFRMAEYWLPKLNVQLCVMLHPPITRLELLFDNGEAGTILPKNASDNYNDQDWYTAHWFINEENHRINAVKNKLAIEKGLRSEIVEDFIRGMKSLFEEHYIDIPEEKVDVVEELTTKVEELESSINEEISRNVEMKKQINEYKKNEAIHAVCEGLTQTQVEKMKQLAESVDFTTDEEFADKLVTLRTSYFTESTVKPAESSALNEEVIVEEDKKPTVSSDPTVAAIASALSKTVVK